MGIHHWLLSSSTITRWIKMKQSNNFVQNSPQTHRKCCPKGLAVRLVFLFPWGPRSMDALFASLPRVAATSRTVPATILAEEHRCELRSGVAAWLISRKTTGLYDICDSYMSTHMVYILYVYIYCIDLYSRTPKACSGQFERYLPICIWFCNYG